MANVVESGAISYDCTDHLGSTVLMTDGSSNVLAGNWPHAYTIFGADDPHYVAPTERRRYTGKERDPESGLDYFESRYYSSAAGRFLSPDGAGSASLSDPFAGRALFSDPGPLPYADITNPQSLNKYAYSEGNPLRFTDPDGHCPLCFFAAGAVLATVAIVKGYSDYERAKAQTFALKRASADYAMALKTDNPDLIAKTSAALGKQELAAEGDLIKLGADAEGLANFGIGRVAAGASAGSTLQQALDDDAGAAKAVIDKTVEQSLEQQEEMDKKKRQQLEQKQEQEQEQSQPPSGSTSAKTQ
ncbi:MAG TPA: RHS repeat-associated core domain-containing protein [Terriglobales bacterium]|nr:RHS repeat-associated core domain-containing protein [Terriglobales bacterium]